MSNYGIMTQNTLLGLSEMAGLLYLELLDAFQGHTDRSGERRAFFAACRYEESCAGVLDYILENAEHPAMGANLPPDLKTFFTKRWLHNFVTRQHPQKED